MSGVRAKFVVREVGRTIQGGTVSLFPVCRGEENKTWSQATPSGEIKMSILNDGALEWFENILKAGKAEGGKPEVFVDFSAATLPDAEVA